MSLHKILKDLGDTSCKSPRDVAQRIIDSMPTNMVISKTEIAGPGFINAHLSRDLLASLFSQILQSGPQMPDLEKQTVVIDFSSPNIAKVGFKLLM